MPTAKKKPTKKTSLTPLPELKKQLTKHTDAFCKELLNKEYRDMCRVMAKGFCIEESPARTGDVRTWAAAIVAAVGMVNALDDAQFTPHYTKAQLAKKMGVPLAELNKHTKVLVSGFDLIPYDPDFTIPSMIALNPLIAMACSPTLLGECCEEGSCCEGSSCSMQGCDKEDCCQLQVKPKKKANATKRK